MKPRILSVDDHEDTLLMLRVLFSAYGYDFISAASAEDGLKMAKAGDFDLFLLDLIYADGTGEQLCERIREFDTETPIVFFSGSHPVKQQEAMTCGAQGFVMKPDLKALRREISQVLNSVS